MFKIIPFNIYKELIEFSPINELIGTQTIYPESLQHSLINTFIKDEHTHNNDIHNLDQELNNNMIQYCFQINNIFLQPKYVYNNDIIDVIMESKCIVVSDEIYNQHFFNIINFDSNYELHTIYCIPSVDMLRLKRIDGDFPEDGSVDELLTYYLESCVIINAKQQFTLQCFTNKSPLLDFITFEVDEIIYKEIPIKNINDRLEEMNLTMIFNKNLLNKENTYEIGLDNCKNKVSNYNWLYNMTNKSLNKKDGTDQNNKNNLVGYLANSEVKIDFIVTENPKVINTPLVNQNVINTPLVEKSINVQTESIVSPIFKGVGDTLNSNNSNDSKQLSIEEIRMKRLQAFSKLPLLKSL